jgi:tubulin gamma
MYAMFEQEDDHALDAQTPIIENMVVGVPPVFQGLTRQLDKIVEQPLLGPKSEFPRGILPQSGLHAQAIMH